MNGIHDMGGMDGFGPVLAEANEPVFHAPWEGRMFALAIATPYAVPYNDDHLRREIERTPPADYLTIGYYALWLRGVESLLRKRGILPGGAVKRGETLPALAADKVLEAIHAGASTRQPEEGIMARFMAGDGVLVRNLNPVGHTRLPRYVRGKRGVVHADRGVFSFPDANSAGQGLKPQHCYTVRFAARELWGDMAPARDSLYLDLWEDYLDSR
ncbi:MAG: nitrile hydratase subunit beta [Dongiaceae bacterium]